VPRVVDKEVIATIVARWTGIPVGKLLSDQVETVKTLDARLKERVIGQDAAIDRISSAMRAARAGLSDARRPPAVFLLIGMSGTGKTETALSLADMLYGGSQYLTTINMSEFKEEHKISMLLGSPPGYVGFGEGGVLTEAVRRRPYGVLLLDEIDKAHPGVQEIFYQVFDKGTLRDGEGRDIDFQKHHHRDDRQYRFRASGDARHGPGHDAGRRSARERFCCPNFKNILNRHFSAAP
jgi:type VI secretion system protein VasG